MRIFGRYRAFARTTDATSAVEFAILAGPLIFAVLAIIQIGLIFISRSVLANAVNTTAAGLTANSFTPTPTAATIKTSICAAAPNMLNCDSTLAVEINTIANLSSGTVAIVDGTTNIGSSGTALAIRAKSTITTFAPGLGPVATVYASAVLRRP